MTQGACERADAAAGSYDETIVHILDVRSTRTNVNVECVRTDREYVYVPDHETTGEKLSRLRARAGLSMRELAAASGYSSASGIQRYVEPAFDKPLPLGAARKLAMGLAGRGQPPIAEDEVVSLTGLPVLPNATPFQMEGASEERMAEDLPIYGSALGATRQIEGEAIEQTTLNRAEVVVYARRPVLLNGNARAYGLYVSGSSMEPRYADGEVILVDPKVRFRSGDDVVVYLRPQNPEEDNGEAARAALVKRFKRRTSEYVELEQFTPALTFKLPAIDVVDIHRVLPWQELIT